MSGGDDWDIIRKALYSGQISADKVDAQRALDRLRPKFGVPPMFAIGSPVWPGLSKLDEEAGEVVQVIGKLMGTGGLTQHWDGSDLRQRLVEEIGDVMAACEFVAQTNDLETEVEIRRRDKLALFYRWHRGN